MIFALVLACATQTPTVAVDAAPGPAAGWLTPRVAEPAPLRLGMTLADAEASWSVSERALGPMRAVEGLILTAPPGKSKAFVVLNEASQTLEAITFLLDAAECPAAHARLVVQYGPSTPGDAVEWWRGVTREVGYRVRGTEGCTIAWKLRKLQE